MAAVVRCRGAHLLNLSFEWGCTCGAQALDAPVLLRGLDWDLPGLGETLAVIHQRGPSGEWWHVGWPGLTGAITLLAPGRFAIAINQPPLPLTRLGAHARRRGAGLAGLLADWTAARPAAWRSRAIPPAHLLRLIADQAPDYATALTLLRDTPIAAAAAFTLVGVAAGEAAVIERLPRRHALHGGAHLAAANPGRRWASPAARAGARAGRAGCA